MAAPSPEEAALGAWNALASGDRAGFLACLAPGETERLTEVCGAFQWRVASMDPQRQSALFSYLLLEAAPDEVSHWQPLDMLELLTGTTTSRRIVDGLHPEFTAQRARADTCPIGVSLPTDTFTLKAVNLAGEWYLIGTDVLLLEILENLPEPWPRY